MADLLEVGPSRALAIYAHPDDPDLSCGGTLARWSARGAAVSVVIATAGEKGSSDPATDPAELASIRSAEVAAAADVLGVEVQMLGHPDGELSSIAGLRAELVALVRRLGPDVVVAPDPTAVFFGDAYVNHPDHRSIGWAVLDAVAPAASSPLYFPGAGSPHQVDRLLLSGSLEAGSWIDVEDTLEAKVAAVFCHRSQLGEDAETWLADAVRSRAEEEGHRAGVRYAEGFRSVRLRP